MEITAPTTEERLLVIWSFLISYNNPLLFLAVFLISFFVLSLLLKKRLLALVIAIGVTLVVATYLSFDYLGRVRS
jgi:hypothetical protein